MLIIKTLPLLKEIIKKWHWQHKSIVLIPTMGNLHEGHMALIDAGRRSRADKLVVSIFVNPMQFDCLKDLETYPRTLQKDFEQLIQHNVDMVFTPLSKIIYLNDLDKQTFVDVPLFSHILEGQSRPGHFRGVATIISKLFNLVQPDIACFGKKDFQQLLLIHQLVKDMGYNVKIIDVPTVRAPDGLALSSRNTYLSKEERRLAPYLNQVMMWLASQIKNESYYADKLILTASHRLSQLGFKPDKLIICDAKTLLPLTTSTRQAVILFSAWLGKVRLIDNTEINFFK